MSLRKEWKWFLQKAWSIRLAALAGVFSGLEAILPAFVDALPRGLFAALSMIAAIGSAIAVVTNQPKMERRCAPRRPGSEADYD